MRRGFMLIVVLSLVSLISASLAEEAEIAQCSTSSCLDRFPNPPSTINQTIVDSFCSSVVFDKELDDCLYAACTIKQALATKNWIAVGCKMPLRDGGTVTEVICSVFGAIAILSVGIRLATQWSREWKIGIDDCLITISGIASVGTLVVALRTTSLGVGRDLWFVYPNATTILKIWLVGEITYLPIVAITRTSIYFFYLRIFSANLTFRRWVYVFITLNILAATLFFFLCFFQCRPISFSWDFWDGQHQGTCLNVRALVLASGFVNVIFDFATLLLPMPILLKLNMRIGRKIQVIAMFCVGAFVGIVSTIRVTSLFSFWNTRNFTWDYNPVLYYSCLEIYVGIICACMPSMRQLVEKGSRKLFSEKGVKSCFGTMTSTSVHRDSPAAAAGSHPSYERPTPSVKIEILTTREVRVTSEYRTLEEQLSHRSEANVAPRNWQTSSSISSSRPISGPGGGGGVTELDMELDFITIHPDVAKPLAVARQDSASTLVIT